MPNDVRIYITGPDHQTLLTPATLLPMGGTGVGCPAGWLVGPLLCSGVDVSGLGIVVTGDFYVVLQPLGRNVPMFDAANSGGSFNGLDLPGLTHASPGDWLIRVDIDPIVPHGAPVGGLIEPVNKLVVFVPYLALFVVLAVIVIAGVPWKKSGN